MTKDFYFKIKDIYGEIVMEVGLDFNDLKLFESISNCLNQRIEIEQELIERFTLLKNRILNSLNNVQIQAYHYEKELDSLSNVHAPEDSTPKIRNSVATVDFLEEKFDLSYPIDDIPVEDRKDNQNDYI